MTNQSQEPSPTAEKAPTKASQVTKLLSRPKGATVADMMTATGWQAHTVRAFLTGVRKKSGVTRETRASGEATYRIDRSGEAIEGEAA